MMMKLQTGQSVHAVATILAVLLVLATMLAPVMADADADEGKGKEKTKKNETEITSQHCSVIAKKVGKGFKYSDLKLVSTDACTQAVADRLIPTCERGETPGFNATNPCCISCTVGASSVCMPKNSQACKKTNVAECGDGEDPSLDSKCCPTCLSPSPTPPSPGASCSATDIKTCLDAAPTCLPGQFPLADDPDRCCSVCRRTSRDCDASDLAKCGARMRACTENELPLETQDSCCPSCRIVANVTQPMVCVRENLFNLTATQCSRTMRLPMRLSDPNQGGWLGRAAAGEIDALLHEVYMRFCDDTGHADLCKALTLALDITKCDIDSVISNDTVVVTCVVAKADTTSRADDDDDGDDTAHPLVVAGLNDAEANQLASVELIGTTGDTADDDEAAEARKRNALLAVLMTIALMALTALIGIAAFVSWRRQQVDPMAGWNDDSLSGGPSSPLRRRPLVRAAFSPGAGYPGPA